MPNIPIENAGYKSIDGMRLLWINIRTLTITAGQARGTDNTNDILFEEDQTLSMDVTGIGGIDVGTSIANSFYYVFAVGDSTKNKPSGVLASRNSVPVLNDYDVYRIIGGFKTSGSGNIDTFAQTGTGRDRWITYESPVQILTGGNATSWAQVIMLNIVPREKNLASVISGFTPSVAANRIMLRNNASAGSGSSILSGDVAGVKSWRETLIPFDNRIFEYQVDAAGDSADLYLKAYLHSL